MTQHGDTAASLGGDGRSTVWVTQWSPVATRETHPLDTSDSHRDSSHDKMTSIYGNTCIEKLPGAEEDTTPSRAGGGRTQLESLTVRVTNKPRRDCTPTPQYTSQLIFAIHISLTSPVNRRHKAARRSPNSWHSLSPSCSCARARQGRGQAHTRAAKRRQPGRRLQRAQT